MEGHTCICKQLLVKLYGIPDVRRVHMEGQTCICKQLLVKLYGIPDVRRVHMEGQTCICKRYMVFQMLEEFIWKARLVFVNVIWYSRC